MRKLRVSTEIIRYVAGHKERIDALAFALLIKQAYVDSIVRDATQRKLKDLFGMGSDKLKKVINDGIEFGFLRWNGKKLIANKLHGEKALSIILKGDWFVEAKNKNKKNKLTLIGVRSIIEMAIFVNQVNMQSNCADTHNRATSGQTVKQVRNAKQGESRMLHGQFNENFTGLSNIRVQQLIGRKKKKALSTIKAAISHGLVSKQVREKFFGVVDESYDSLARKVLREMNVFVSVQLGYAVLRFSNEYSYLSDIISYANHGC